jgi:Domain of unknown function (DUF5004)
MKQILLTLLTITILFGACKKEPIPPIGDPASKLEGINGNWRLAKIEQYDENVAVDNKYLDITEYFLTGQAAPTLSFNSAAKTFTYDPAGTPNFLGTSGAWRFDDDAAPSFIYASSAGADEQTWQLGGPTRPVDQQFSILVKRGCVSDSKYYYRFTFARSN